ncbi:MAG: hypothetical protein KJZ90_00780 [Rhodocyclaceae bacterium]|nr:hypothetical protein [Rhodocyclaceae bacterium]
MLLPIRKTCPYCGRTFEIGLGEILNGMTRKEWGVYCPECSTRSDFRFGFGSSLFVSALLAISIKWLLQLSGELALAGSFVGFFLAGILLALTSPLVARPFERAQYERKKQKQGKNQESE